MQQACRRIFSGSYCTDSVGVRLHYKTILPLISYHLVWKACLCRDRRFCWIQAQNKRLCAIDAPKAIYLKDRRAGFQGWPALLKVYAKPCDLQKDDMFMNMFYIYVVDNDAWMWLASGPVWFCICLFFLMRNKNRDKCFRTQEKRFFSSWDRRYFPDFIIAEVFSFSRCTETPFSSNVTMQALNSTPTCLCFSRLIASVFVFDKSFSAFCKRLQRWRDSSDSW